MQEHAVPATAEGMPRFNRSQILRDAWARYRGWAEMDGGRFSRKYFGYALKAAWQSAKEAAALETQVAGDPAYTARAGEIRDELRCMDYSDAPTNWERHRNLTAELFRLSTEGGARQAA